jgi:hypothetical protein
MVAPTTPRNAAPLVVTITVTEPEVQKSPVLVRQCPYVVRA